MKEFSIEELLQRDPVEVDLQSISLSVKDNNVLVTGASGSIGSELCRLLCFFEPKSIILFDRNENNQFFLEKELKEKFPNLNIIPRLGSITDKERVRTIFKETLPDIVFHTAANKHVPLSESNVSEAIHNNIYGTKVVASVASEIKCSTFVLISTDKAVKPTSVMGATKRIAELCIQYIANNNKNTKFITVRFGNVLGSSGSVVPIFKSQIVSGGPITVTHPDMTRYFMTIPEACKLVLQASVIGESGNLFILDMGKSVKISDLALNMIRLSGLTTEDIKINYSGMRPGEKIYEELSYDSEQLLKTSHSKINRIDVVCPDDSFFEDVSFLINLFAGHDPNLLKKHLSKLIPEANLK